MRGAREGRAVDVVIVVVTKFDLADDFAGDRRLGKRRASVVVS